MAGLHFDITGDNSNFIRKLHECENGVKNASKQIEQSGLGIEDLFNRMTKAAAAFGAGFTAKELISNIAKVRGEFQQLEVAFRTMLGSEDKANALMQQLVKTAATTPFDLQGVANGAKQLLAYGENVENVNDDLIRLGNIAAGLSQPLGDIVYLYGTTMTQGRLYTQDLNQFTGRGIPMIRELAKVFGVAEGEVKSLVEAGKVGFPEVQKVIQNLTNEGGMFYNLMQEQSKTITGQISNIEDAISTMFNEIGKANEGIINDALSGVSYLVENYEKVGRILIEIVGTYGAYRTALMVTNALQALQASGITALTAKEAAHYGWLVLTKKAQDALNLSMLKNPYVLAAAAIAGLAYGIYKLATAESETEKAIRETNNALEAQKSHYDDLKNKAGELSNILSNESKSIEERFIAYRQLQRLMPEVFQNMDWETAKRKTNAELIKLETDEMLRQQRIGLKTKVVMSQQKVQGLENSIIRTTNRGGYTGALKEDLAAAKKELEIYTKALEDFEKADEQAKKESEKPVIFNKKYWEGQKKEAEDALNSIASSQKKLLDAGKFEGIDASVIKSYKDNTKKLKEAEKELKVYDSSSKRESAANKQKKEQQKTAEELLSLRRQNQQAEINLMKEGTEKKLKQIDLDYQKELDAIKKQEKELSEKQKGKLTSEQSIEISDRYTNAENKRDKAIADITKEQLKAEQQALNDYLKEYGTFQQQKFAIAQEYAEKIKKVQEENGVNSAQVKLLEKQRDVAIQNKETEAIKANIDWVTVFGEFGSMFNDMIKPALEEAKKYVQTDKFKSSDQDSQKALIDAINQMEQSLGGAGGLNFKKLGQDIKAYQLAEQNRLAAIEEETMAHDKLAKAQDDYTKALKSGTEEEKKAAQNAFEIAQQNANAASINVQAQTSAANEMQQSLTNTATALKANMENVTSGLQKLSSGGIKNAYEGLLQIGKGAGGAMEKFADKLDKVPIVGWIISIIDVFKDGLSDFVGTLLDSVFNAVSGILSDVLSGDLFVTLGKSIRDGVSNIFNAISFGGFDSLINKISGSNAKEVQEAIDRLTDRNETLEKSIDRLTDVMDKSAGSKSISAYEQAYKYQKEQIDNTLKIAREQARYSNSHHSWQYYMEWNDEQLRWVRENVDKNFSGTNSLWGLTPEQMRELLSNADIYEQIKSSGKGGYGERVMEKLEAYADQAGKLDELTEKINESLMQISFDGLRDNFLESLMDMDKDAKSFSEDFSEYMQRALLNFSMGELFDDELREWYNGIAKLMKENGGKLTKQQLEDARKEYDAMVQDAINERDKIAEITGYTGSSSSSQEASKKVSASVTQDSIDEVSGRFTALQIAGEEIKNQMIAVVVGVNSLIGISSAGNETLSNILNQHVITNSYLEDITKYTKLLNDIRADISEVKVNTKGLSTR
ncbi:tape measure protein [Bacteroides ovatus]|jgi:tape measure domain-containing protein|uniref:tape measure protein n=1 Tax=Bacteroides ovatus TaxID=28116 RepID=UPI00123061B5|nr:tape measure protein [Bacteroides ovatus]KAA3994637.1 tape measure protein [Bacteroides ovatus]KAA3994833.1 tape measure protein [Bacteroides ovatus]MCE8751734.1 tape measure protein [Bacteroides ovatus]